MTTPSFLTGWGDHLLSKFLRQIRAYSAAFTERIFPTFDSIDSESQIYADELYDQLARMPHNDSMDMADLADYVLEEGIEHYQTLSGVRQAILSIALTGLYHMVEQQILFFLRKEILHPRDEDEHSKLSVVNFVDRLESKGIHLSDFQSWQIIGQLRLVSNVVKHGEGRSAEQLRSACPDLFNDPAAPNDMPLLSKSSVFQPLAGEDIYPTPEDFNMYVEAAKSFWTEFLSAYFAR